MEPATKRAVKNIFDGGAAKLIEYEHDMVSLRVALCIEKLCQPWQALPILASRDDPRNT